MFLESLISPVGILTEPGGFHRVEIINDGINFVFISWF